jgi:hypothetical protein
LVEGPAHFKQCITVAAVAGGGGRCADGGGYTLTTGQGDCRMMA